MRRGTTPTIKIVINDFDMTLVDKWYITFEQCGTQITKTNDDITIENNTILIPISQAEALSFMPTEFQCQINAISTEGERIASGILTSTWTDNLYNEVITV